MTEQTVLVIGNSDGIGLAFTKLLLERGFRVQGLSRSLSPIRQERYRHVVVDVTTPEYPLLLQQLVERDGRIDHVVYCAGIGERTDPETLARDVRVFEVNLLAAVRTAQVLVPAMLRSGGGRFIVLSSQADGIVSHEATSYCASKAAMSSYFEGLALKLNKTSLCVTNVRFGFVDTKMARAGIQPFKITSQQAAQQLLGLVVGRRRHRLTYPKRMAVMVFMVALVQKTRLFLA